MATLTTTLTYSEPVGSLVATLGAPGPSGQAATIEVGTTETGAPGSDAFVVNVGTSSAAIFDFTIPRGDQGIQGIQGIQGPQGEKGDKGDQGDPGPAGVVAATAPLAYDSLTQTISIDLAGYATESWVQSQGYITGWNGGTVYNSVVVKASEESQGGATHDYQSLNFAGEPGFYGADGAYAGLQGFTCSLASYPAFPSVSLTPGYGLTVVSDSNTTVVNDGILTFNGSEPYARLDGASFTGKVNFTPIDGVAGLNIGVGGTSAASVTPGDLYINTGTPSLLRYRDANSVLQSVPILGATNTFTAPQIINAQSSTLPALRVTQRGTGETLIVEDSTNPDTDALIVDQNGNVGIGVATGYTSTSKVEVVGNVKADTFSNGAGPVFSVNSTAAHTGGSDTLDLIVTIGGVNYRIGLRPA